MKRVYGSNWVWYFLKIDTHGTRESYYRKTIANRKNLMSPIKEKPNKTPIKHTTTTEKKKMNNNFHFFK